jgi:hypothetical protein
MEAVLFQLFASGALLLAHWAVVIWNRVNR